MDAESVVVRATISIKLIATKILFLYLRLRYLANKETAFVPEGSQFTVEKAFIFNEHNETVCFMLFICLKNERKLWNFAEWLFGIRILKNTINLVLQVKTKRRRGGCRLAAEMNCSEKTNDFVRVITLRRNYFFMH